MIYACDDILRKSLYDATLSSSKDKCWVSSHSYEIQTEKTSQMYIIGSSW